MSAFKISPALSLLSAAALLLAAAWSASAQEDPFGAPPKAAEGEQPEGAKGRPVVVPDTSKREPLVIEMLRASNPTAPADLLQAAQAALQYGRPDESKLYLAKLLAAKPADEVLAGFGDRHGDLLLQLSSTEELQPEGKQIADLIYAAANKSAQDADRLTAAVRQLSNSSPAVRERALITLSRAGTGAINPLLAVLTDVNRQQEQAAARLALVELAQTSEQPLLGALESNDDKLLAQIVAVLGRMESRLAQPRLVRLALDSAIDSQTRTLAEAALRRLTGAAPNLYDADRYLQRQIELLSQGELPIAADVDDRVRVWTWDATKGEVAPLGLTRRDAGAYLAARMAADLHRLRNNDESLRLMLVTSLEWAKIAGGLDRPLQMAPGGPGSAALAAGAKATSGVLAEALRTGRDSAAIAAAEVLGQAGDASILQAPADAASPLAEAMLSSDRRVRLAAALAAVQLDAGGAFPGAGRIADTLAWFLRTGGSDSVLVGHPRGEDAQSVVGFMHALGYDGEAAYWGRVLVERAVANPDYSFVLISGAIDSPPVEELVQWLRRDARTARVPIGVMARGERFDLLREALASDRNTTVFPRIHSVEVADAEVAKLKAIGGRSLVLRQERLDQARSSLGALATLASGQQNFASYELMRHETTIADALNNAALAEQACGVLALLGGPKSQTALVDFASQESRDLAARQAAAAAFSSAKKLRGLLLTQQQIARQFERYNESERFDKPTQELLASILDAIESPRGPVVAPAQAR